MHLRNFFLFAVLLAGTLSTAHAETLDGTFASDGRLVDYDTTRDYRSVAAFTEANGDVVRVFTFTGSCGACIALVRSSATGVLLAARNLDAGLMSVVAAAMDQNGRVVVVGSTTASGSLSFVGVVRLNRDLSNDTSFAGDGGMFMPSTLTEVPTSVAIDRNNRIVVAGRRLLSPSDTDFVVLRVNENGTPDTTFNGSGRRLVVFDLGNTERYDEARAVAIGNDGKIVVVGTAYDSAILRNRIAMARLNPDGSWDTGFCTACAANPYPSINSGRALYFFGSATGHEDIAAAVDTTSGGGFVIAGTMLSDDGTTSSAAIARFHSNGDFRAERIEAGFGGQTGFSAVKAVEGGAALRVYAAGHTAFNRGWLMLQAFDAGLSPVSGYGSANMSTTCLTGSSGICFAILANIGADVPAQAAASSGDIGEPTMGVESPTGDVYDYGPDAASALSIDQRGRPLLSGQGTLLSAETQRVVTARYTNATGPLPDLIFRHGFQ